MISALHISRFYIKMYDYMDEKMAMLGKFFTARAGLPKPKKGTVADAKKVPKGHQKKWLTPLGVKVIDEAHRAPTPELPHQLLEDFYQLECEDGPEYCGSLSSAAMRALVDNADLKLQRVFIYGNGNDDFIDCDILENLHKHPCEEIHVRRASCSEKAAEYLAKCSSIKVISFDDCSIGGKSAKMLIDKLPHLEEFSVLSDSMFEKIAKAKAFKCYREFEDECLKPYLDYISANEDSIELADIGRCGKAVLDALTACPNLKSLSYTDAWEDDSSDTFLKPFLSNTDVQKRLEHISLRKCRVGSPTFKLLAKFSNLKWLNLNHVFIPTADLKKIIENNSAHIVDIDAAMNGKLKEGVLEAVAKCKKLNRIDLRMTGVTKVAVNRYKSEKKPNHGAILNKMYGDIRHPYHMDDYDF